MKNKLLLGVIALLAVMALAGKVYSDATATTTVSTRATRFISQSVAVADGTLGYTANVDSRGAVSVQEYPKTLGTVSGTDALVYTGAARVTSITVAGDGTSALDHVEIYDALSATGTPKFEVSIGTAGETKHIEIPGGGTFATGIYVSQSANNMLVTIGYDT